MADVEALWWRRCLERLESDIARDSAMDTKKLFLIIRIFLFSILGSLLVAVVFAVTIDGRISLSALGLPATVPVLAIIAVAAGILVAPMAVFCLRRKRLRVIIPAVYALMAAVTVGLNILLPLFELNESGIVLAALLVATVLLLVLVRYVAPDVDGR